LVDAAVMPLVIFFLSSPARGVAEMARVAVDGGLVTSYGWDMTTGGFPYEILFREMRAIGLEVPSPPSPEASRIDRLQESWAAAGLEGIATTEIVVERTFTDFADYWATILGASSVGRQLRALAAPEVARLQDRLRGALSPEASGRIRCSARANAVQGTVRR
jgi:hypothetical protein